MTAGAVKLKRPVVAVLDYGIGNLRSAQKSLERVGADARLTADPDEIAAADAVVLPGVGNFGRVAEAIRSAGLDAIAVEAARSERPFLGICVGMQVMYTASEESPGVRGLGIFPGAIVELSDDVKRPQMQWNQLRPVGDDPPELDLFAGLGLESGEGPWVYFVHSFAAEPDQHTIATCDYGGPVVASVRRGSTWATQFHPEKSGKNGLRLLENFVGLATAWQHKSNEQKEPKDPTIDS